MQGSSGQSKHSTFWELPTVGCGWGSESEGGVAPGNGKEVGVRKGTVDPVVTARSLKDFGFETMGDGVVTGVFPFKT